jgi:hypothetical protein
MVRSAVTRSLEIAILLMAAYTFFFVKVGTRTPCGHVTAILRSPPARLAGQEFSQAGQRIMHKLSDEAIQSDRPDAGP